MVHKLLVTMGALLVLGLLCGGCAEDICNKLCDHQDRCADHIADCVDLCVDDYEEANGDCQAAMSEFAGCVDGRSCTSIDEHCVSEAVDYLQECF